MIALVVLTAVSWVVAICALALSIIDHKYTRATEESWREAFDGWGRSIDGWHEANRALQEFLDR